METSKRLPQLLPPMDLLGIPQRHSNKFRIFAREKNPPTDEGGKPTLDVPTIMYEPAAGRSATATRLSPELHDASPREASCGKSPMGNSVDMQ